LYSRRCTNIRLLGHKFILHSHIYFFPIFNVKQYPLSVFSYMFSFFNNFLGVYETEIIYAATMEPKFVLWRAMPRRAIQFFSLNQGCQFCFVSFEKAEIFHTNSKNTTKQNKFYLILNLGPFRIFRLNSVRNVPVSFYMFHSALEKPLNQIEPCSI